MKLVCHNCNAEEILDGDVPNFNIVSYPNSTQVSIECVICGTISDIWTWESTLDINDNDINMESIYTESNDFNNFLELFEEEEFKEEHCEVCGIQIKTRASIEADKYICEKCNNKIIDAYLNNKIL